MLRHLLILLDGRAPLAELQSYYPHKDITVAALLLWHHGYAEPVQTSSSKPGFLRKMLWGKSADNVAPQISSEHFVDSLQSVFPGTQGEGKPRFSESGKYWFSHGGRSLSHEAKAMDTSVPQNSGSEHIDLPLNESRKTR